MAEKKYNLDAVLNKYIHRPVFKTDTGYLPLYGRSGNESESQDDAELAKNKNWVQKSQITYNSPTNVRRLFIGDRKIFIQYYQPPISNGKSSGKYWSECTYDSEEALGEIGNDILTYNNRVQEALSNNAKIPAKTRMIKTGLGALHNSWTMSNLEELYISPMILLSEDIQSIISPAKAMKILNFFSNTPAGKAISDRSLVDIFERVNGNDVKNIRNRFPRLRFLAFMSNIEDAINLPNVRNLREGLPEQNLDIALNWMTFALNHNVNSVSSFVYSSVAYDKSIKFYSSFAVRPGIYKFDAEVLSIFGEKYKNKVLEIGRQNRDKDKDEKPNDTISEAHELEKYLDEIVAQYDPSMVTVAAKLALARYKSGAIKEMYEQFTPEGKDKYKDIFSGRWH